MALAIEDAGERERFAASLRGLSRDELNRREAALLREQYDTVPEKRKSPQHPLPALSEAWTPLHLALAYGSVEDAQALLARGVRLEQTDARGDQIVHHVALAGNVPVLTFLLEQHGADVNARGQYDCTPLHYAAYKGHTAAAACLLDHGADIHAACSWYGRRPLGQAARMGNFEVARLLLDRGADPNDLDALHQADESSRVDPYDADEYGLARETAQAAFRIAKLMAERGSEEIKAQVATWH
jgi:hypothetical protein